jgi:hypothetical protein
MISRTSIVRAVSFGFAVLAFAVDCSAVSSWLNTSGGSWADPTQWDTNPIIPNVAGAPENFVLNSGGAILMREGSGKEPAIGGGFAVHPFLINIISLQYPQSPPKVAFRNVLALSGGRDATAAAAFRRAALIVQSTRHQSKNLIERSLRVELSAGAGLCAAQKSKTRVETCS